MCDAARDIGDVQERIGEGRGGKLVVLGERATVDVEALRAGVGDEEGGDGGAGVVQLECDREGLRGEEREEGGVGGVRCAMWTLVSFKS